MNHVEFMNLFASFPQLERDRIELAYILSKDAHRSQTRIDGERYFEHPRRVALIAFQEIFAEDWEDICASLLHDTVEDTKYITIPKIRRWFGIGVADRVNYLTKIDGQVMRDYYDRIGSWPTATVLKGCDRLDNLRSLGSCDKPFIRKQLHGTRKHVVPMLEKLAFRWGTPGESPGRALKLLGLINQELEKFKDFNGNL